MLQAVRRAAVTLRQAPFLLTEASRGSSLLAVKSPFDISAEHFATTSHTLNVSTARDISEQEIANIRQRVFGIHIGNGLPSGRKILRKKLVGEKIAAYYDHARPIKDPLIVDLNAEK